MTWAEGTIIGVRTDYPSGAQAIFLNTSANVCILAGVSQPSIPTPNQWHALDLTPVGVPIDCLAVRLEGFLIITDGSSSKIPDLNVAYKAPSAALSPLDYVEQTIGIGSNGGSRTNAGRTVPCEKGIINWAWLRGDGASEWPDKPIPDYPVGAAYGLNITVDFYVRPQKLGSISIASP